MKTYRAILILLASFCLITSFQCDKCSTRTLRLDDSRSWLNVKGTTQLAFVDNTNSISNFKLKVIDTIETAANNCGDLFQFENLNTTLYLNPTMSDSIHFILGSGSWLCMRAVSDGKYNINICNVLSKSPTSTVVSKISNYTVGSRMYRQVVLVTDNHGTAGKIDSVMIANNAGLIGFNYENKRYFLQ